jgi:hypothetical protein
MVLGLLRRFPSGWQTTEQGRALCGPDETETRRLLAGVILGHPLVTTAAAKLRPLRDAQRRQETLARLLYLSTALSESTSQRRAQTLLAWLDWAQEMSEGTPGLFHDIPPAPEEPQDAAVA